MYEEEEGEEEEGEEEKTDVKGDEKNSGLWGVTFRNFVITVARPHITRLRKLWRCDGGGGRVGGRRRGGGVVL
ncbi:hypothetical protein E2C01_100284 [Portunus trituberculatus]|uniref:Uncharacterized protein n=1 Tax=Portunus trituberculatus TaxID=210409 RepID=A0A5B7KH55_PORTR|nr:hypothetical protein [Portunus trituberculatus]